MALPHPQTKRKYAFGAVGFIFLALLGSFAFYSIVYIRSTLEDAVGQTPAGQTNQLRFDFQTMKGLGIVSDQ